MLGYAASRGLADVAVVVPPGAFGARAMEGAEAAVREIGITLSAPIVTADPAALGRALAEGPPGAVYLPAAGPELPGLVAAAKAAGAQPLVGPVVRAGSRGRRHVRGHVVRGPRYPAVRGLRAGARGAGDQPRHRHRPRLRRGGDGPHARARRPAGSQGPFATRRVRGVLGSYRFLPSGLALRGLSVTDGRIGTLATTGA